MAETRRDLIVGNWKMNATHLEAIQMIQKLAYRLNVSDFDRIEVVVAPPFTALRSVQTVIEADQTTHTARVVVGVVLCSLKTGERSWIAIGWC